MLWLDTHRLYVGGWRMNAQPLVPYRVRHAGQGFSGSQSQYVIFPVTSSATPLTIEWNYRESNWRVQRKHILGQRKERINTFWGHDLFKKRLLNQTIHIVWFQSNCAGDNRDLKRWVVLVYGWRQKKGDTEKLDQHQRNMEFRKDFYLYQLTLYMCVL